MRRKPSAQGNGNYNNNNNQQRGNKPRFQSGGGGHGNHGGQNRPRKNYAANREKYLAQARDALAQGDRVLAENYFQHADHCYRMMVEEGYNTRNNNHQNQHQQGDNNGNANADQQADNAGNQQRDDDDRTDTITQLPAFLHTSVIEDDHKTENSPQQNWEE